MNVKEKASELLFSYGTLQEEAVQLATFGRRLEGAPDFLVGYRITLIPIRDQSAAQSGGATHYRNIRFTGAATDTVEGTVYKVTGKELERADRYEKPAGYKRVTVLLNSGAEAWVYLNTDQ
jgi:hypothetical protein